MRKILVVDDEYDVADSLVIFLETFGAEARAAYGCAAALDALETFKPEVVLLDLGMPGIDGFETARRIRAIPDGADIKIIALTAWNKDRVKEAARGFFDDHLVKPAPVELLCKLLLCDAQCSHRSKPCALFSREIAE